MGTASIPGTGISYREHFGTTQTTPPNGTWNPTPYLVPPPPFPTESPYVNAAPIEQIHSASTEQLTSETLKDLKKLIQTAFQQREEIICELNTGRNEKSRAIRRYESWDKGFLFKRLFKGAFAKRKEESETATDKVAELEEQLRLSTISTYIEVDKEQGDFYYRMKDEFAALCQCVSIWDVKSHQSTDKYHERTTANVRVERNKVGFRLDSCDLIRWDQSIPHLQNAKGGDFYLYPGFILYRAAREAFSVIEYQDVKSAATFVRFQEEDGVPGDSTVVGQTWAKANKDGSRDKRFASNYQIPIVQYGLVTLKSHNGLWEEFHFSNPQKMVGFITALRNFTESFAAVSHT